MATTYLTKWESSSPHAMYSTLPKYSVLYPEVTTFTLSSATHFDLTLLLSFFVYIFVWLSHCLYSAVRRDIITFTTYQDDNFHFFITCNVDGAPATPTREVTWSYTEDDEDEMLEMIPAGDEGSHRQVLENSTLLIRNYSPEDAGRYYCNALLGDGTRKLKRIDVGGMRISLFSSIGSMNISNLGLSYENKSHFSLL